MVINEAVKWKEELSIDLILRDLITKKTIGKRFPELYTDTSGFDTDFKGKINHLFLFRWLVLNYKLFVTSVSITVVEWSEWFCGTVSCYDSVTSYINNATAITLNDFICENMFEILYFLGILIQIKEQQNALEILKSTSQNRIDEVLSGKSYLKRANEVNMFPW